MRSEDERATKRQSAIQSALRRTLHETAQANPLPQPLLPDLPAAPTARDWWRPRWRVAAGLGAIALALLVAGAGLLAIQPQRQASPLPTSAVPAQAPSFTTGTAGPAPTLAPTEATRGIPGAVPVLGTFEPVLDVAEPQITTGSAAMHESFGSAADGVVYVKDYGFSSGGGNNVYHVTVYRSFDGIVWQTVEVPVPADQQDSVIACRGWNCLLATNFPQNGALRVTDDGRQWETVAGAPKVINPTITAGTNGFVLTGTELATGRFRALFSADGRDWHDVGFNSPSQDFHPGSVVSDATHGWFMFGSVGPAGGAEPAMAVSSDGLAWHEVPDSQHVYQSEFLAARSAFHYNDRWYVVARYRQMPDGYLAGGLGMPVSSATPVATWSIVYWVDDGSATLRSSGRISTIVPDQVVAMDGWLVGARPNDDFTSSVLVSSDGLTWTEEGLLPPGVPRPASIHGIPLTFNPPIRRAGPNVVVASDPLKPNEMGVGLYVARPRG